MKKALAFILILALVSAFCSCKGDENPSLDPAESDGAPSYETVEGETPKEVTLADLSIFDFEFSKRDIDASYDDKVINVGTPDSDYEITSEGSYIFSGDITDVQIRVKAGDNDKIQIVLSNASIKNSKKSAIYIASADKVFITSEAGTVNSISDGSNYNETDAKGEIDGAIFSRADLTVNDEGSLTVNGCFKHGIVSKDDLRICKTTLSVDAKNVALNGKDCVKISDSTLNLTAGSDGIRASNDEDEDRGYVYIEGGNIKISSFNDAIQAETVVKIASGEFEIIAGGGANGKATDADESYKGIKAASDVYIQGGSLKIDSLDDAIHSNKTVCIEGGEFTLSSGDDGIHADEDLSVCAGSVKVEKSYEGLEATRIFITGGEFDLTASDDGLNAAGGNDQSAGNNPGNNFAPPPNGGGFGGGGFGGGNKPGGFGTDGFGGGVGEIIISGGYILIDASGDGIDSNGSIDLSGGIVLVSGPTNNGNGAFDYDKSAKVSGGTLIALGSNGMAQSFSEAENQGAILVSFSQMSAGTSFCICDSNGDVIASFTPKKAYASATVTTPSIKQGEKYSIYCGAMVESADENGYTDSGKAANGKLVKEITMEELLYGGSGGMFPGGGGGGKPGRR